MADGAETVLRAIGGRRTAWRRKTFLDALAASGNVGASCKAAAGLSKQGFYAWRREDAAFAADWLRALDAADARLREGGSTAAGAIVRRNRGRAQLSHARPDRWSAATEALFLATLSATANISAAARATGFSESSAYARRRQWPSFREDWDAALDEGVTRLEWLLIEHATNLMRPAAAAGEDGGDGADAGAGAEANAAARVAAAGPPDPELALQLIRHHRGLRKGARNPGAAAPRREPDMEQVRRSVLDKLAALDRFERRRG